MKNWDNLRFCAAVAKCKTVMAAANYLGVSHATVIRRVNELEAELNCPLFKRSQKGYQLTQAGEQLVSHIKQMEQQVNKIHRFTSLSTQTIEGKLRVSCPESDMVNLYPAINQFASECPGIQIEMDSRLTRADLNDKHTDVAIRLTNQPPENLVGRKLTKVHWGAFVSQHYLEKGKNLKELQDLDWILWVHKKFVIAQSWMDENVGNTHPILVAQTSSEVLNAVKSGLGVGLVSHDIAEQNELICVAEAVRSFDLWVLTHVDLRKVPRVSAFMKFLAEYYQ